MGGTGSWRCSLHNDVIPAAHRLVAESGSRVHFGRCFWEGCALGSWVFPGLGIALLGTIIWAFFWSGAVLIAALVVLLIVIAYSDYQQTGHALWRNFPVLGRGRWVMEFLRPFFRQYFGESDTDGAPVSRMFRSVVYQRAKGVRDTTPLGTRLDTYRDGYEWIAHSLAASHGPASADMRVDIGGPACRQPYSASVLNISAMSFGSLSDNAVRALNTGAAKGSFAHNTGEGGISPYHLESGGDLIWQIGTGYFGARDDKGEFNDDAFAANARRDSVRMIEIKLSQGAKPGHGGILPAAKNTDEIAAIRGVKPGTTVVSPPGHSAFQSASGMMEFVARLRDLSCGKPIGIKLCIGEPAEFFELCAAMLETGCAPDFVTVDGAEGGTGAAPLEFSNSVGMPVRDGLALVHDCLVGYGLREDVRVIASGKVFSAFHAIKLLSLGADAVNSARGMMLALGCVQSLICNTNECPTGIATQHPHLKRGLVVSDKAERVARYHDATVEAMGELLGAAGLHSAADLRRSHLFRRVDHETIRRYSEIYPDVETGCFMDGEVPDRYAALVAAAAGRNQVMASS